MWMSLVALTLLAEASPAAICASVHQRLGDGRSNVDDVTSLVRQDDRLYGPEVLECLCVVGAPPEVHREARRKVLRATVDEAQEAWRIAVGDPLTTPAFQVSTLLARRLDAAQFADEPFAVLPTHLAPPSWLDVHNVTLALRNFEVSGVRLPDPLWLRDQGITDLPTGRVADLLAGEVLPTYSLTNLRGSYDRVLWLDVEAQGDGATAVSWAAYDIAGRPPYTEVTSGTVQLFADPSPFSPGCLEPHRAAERRWQRRLAWPAPRVATVGSGVALAAVFGALSLHEFLAFQGADPLDPRNPGRVSRNVAFGTTALAGGALLTVGLAVPAKTWWRL